MDPPLRGLERAGTDGGAYSPTELDRLDALVAGLHAAGLKVIFTTGSMPEWAQDSSLWRRPPAGIAQGPQPFYVIRKGAVDDYGRLGRLLASRYKGRVQALESWNEPNLWTFFYPQRLPAIPTTLARIYLRMLRAFHAGVHRPAAGVRVIAGATAPVGLNDVYRTSPQRFARFLAARAPPATSMPTRTTRTRRAARVSPRPATPQRPHHDRDAVQSPDPVAALPAQAVLPDGVRLRTRPSAALRRVLGD